LKIVFHKLSDEEHTLLVERRDGSTESRTLNSRSFLRHELAHLAVELELPVKRGYWGSVASGQPLDGMDIRGPDIALAEALAVRVQGLMREENEDPDRFLATLDGVRDHKLTLETAQRICERSRQLRGHWRATPFCEDMVVHWTIPVSD